VQQEDREKEVADKYREDPFEIVINENEEEVISKEKKPKKPIKYRPPQPQGSPKKGVQQPNQKGRGLAVTIGDNFGERMSRQFQEAQSQGIMDESRAYRQ
jgi:hypothetical protein